MVSLINRRAATAMLLSAAALTQMTRATAASPAIKVPTRGFNLPDWLAAEAHAPAPAVLDALRRRGFETIRLPIDPMLVSVDFAPRVTEALALTTTHGFNAILDVHPSGDVDPDQIVAAWTTLAELIASFPAHQVYAELCNEPPLDPKPWARLASRLAETIRRTCPEHTLIWGPARVQGIWELDGQTPPGDGNLIVAVHYYTPMGFTHQCETWDDSPLARMRNLPFPATRKSGPVEALAATFSAKDRAFLDQEFSDPWTAAHIEADFKTLGRWSRTHKHPAMLGEFGVLNFCVDPASRQAWVRAVRQAAEDSGAGWTYWEADQGFGFIADRASAEGFDDGMIEALIG